MLKFMTGLFSEGIGYSGINTAKSAISSLASVVLDKDIGSHVLIKWFMKGIFNKKISLPQFYFYLECNFGAEPSTVSNQTKSVHYVLLFTY